MCCANPACNVPGLKTATLLISTETEPRRAALRGNQTNEAYLSTLEARPQKAARFPCPHGHQGRPARDRYAPRARPPAAVRLGGARARTPWRNGPPASPPAG